MTLDPELEAVIDAAGREKVFAYVQRMGWAPGTPVPKRIWWCACAVISEGLVNKYTEPKE